MSEPDILPPPALERGVSAAHAPAWLAATLRPGLVPRALDAGIQSFLGQDAERAEYDAFGPAYDRVVSNRVYTRLVWGASPAQWTAFARTALQACDTGPLLDVACGSLTFTADVYAQATRPVVLLDRSVAMLGMARARLGARGGGPRCCLVHADARALPFRDGAFPTVACHGSLHVFDDPTSIVAELARAVAPGGELFATCLVDTGRWLARRMMKFARRKGHFGPMRTADEVAGLVRAAMGSTPDLELRGSMAYLRARAPR
ncbi:MAG: class I SAM-dependent methyltransferase [Polyangiaceae bacterium]|nr:class I SAM-dependent methyltransferase [Polyangiaceae bacterium]